MSEVPLYLLPGMLLYRPKWPINSANHRRSVKARGAMALLPICDSSFTRITILTGPTLGALFP